MQDRLRSPTGRLARPDQERPLREGRLAEPARAVMARDPEGPSGRVLLRGRHGLARHTRAISRWRGNESPDHTDEPP
jgi:hypothetical protein